MTLPGYKRILSLIFSSFSSTEIFVKPPKTYRNVTSCHIALSLPRTVMYNSAGEFKGLEAPTLSNFTSTPVLSQLTVYVTIYSTPNSPSIVIERTKSQFFVSPTRHLSFSEIASVRSRDGSSFSHFSLFISHHALSTCNDHNVLFSTQRRR